VKSPTMGRGGRLRVGPPPNEPVVRATPLKKRMPPPKRSKR